MLSRSVFDAVYASFFEDHEDEDEYFFPAPMPSKDMWKKFELLPTPPLSPRHESDVPINNTFTNLLDNDLSNIYLELADFDEKDHPPEKVPYPESPPPSLTWGQDPMWSGHVMDGEIQRISEQKACDVKSAPVRAVTTPSVDLGPTESECIDPQSVFAYNLQENQSEPSYRNMGTETPSDSEEEIDVVNVTKNKQQSTHNKKATAVSSSLLSHALSDVHSTHNYSKPHIHVSFTSHKNNANKRTMKFVIPSSSLLKRNNKSADNSPCQSPSKRVKRETVLPEVDQIIDCLDIDDARTCLGRTNKRRNSPELSPDSEPTFGPVKRNQHNVLERKRRNDLKSSFFLLRDAVPDLLQSDRTPKVVILQKAADYIEDLKTTGELLANEVESQKVTRTRLLDRLHRLQKLQAFEDEYDAV